MSLLEELGKALKLTERPCKSVKGAQGLCNSVYPSLSRLLSGPLANNLLGSSPELLPVLLQHSIPANLVAFMGLALRAGFPSGDLPPSAANTSLHAAAAWALAADFFKGMLDVCYLNRNSPMHQTHCKAVLDQLQPHAMHGQPGMGLHLTYVMCIPAACGSVARLVSLSMHPYLPSREPAHEADLMANSLVSLDNCLLYKVAQTSHDMTVADTLVHVHCIRVYHKFVQEDEEVLP